MKPIISKITLLATMMPVIGAVMFGVVFAADQRYVQTSELAYILTRAKIGDLQYQIDELEYTAANERKLTKKENWQLLRLKTQVNELKETN